MNLLQLIMMKLGVNWSDILITKILMGTLGCVPEYDRYFVTK